jgi:RNA polymerase sigma-70 factor, ECF subfamily
MEDQDAALLRALQDEHGDALFAHAIRLTGGDRQRANDLVQETLLRAWRHPEALDPERVRAWLFTVAADLSDAFAGDPDRAVEAWTVSEALARLSAQHREVLIEGYYRGRSIAETAARLGLPPATVKSRTHFALRSLRTALDEMGVTG